MEFLHLKLEVAMKKEIVILSLGGSLVVPDEIDIDFLKSFRDLMLKHIAKKRFFIYVGGGRTARKYQRAMRELGANSRQLDWLGIETTRLNAKLLKSLFSGFCHPRIISDPTKKIKVEKEILVAAGWKPGWSTDYDAVLLAKNFKVKKIINLTNVDYVYGRDPKKFPGAKFFTKLNWQDFRKITERQWSPGLSLPFDPVASKLAQSFKLQVIIINGRKLKRLENFLNKKPFLGTIVG